MKSKVIRKETFREAGESTGKQFQGSPTDDLLLKKTSE